MSSNSVELAPSADSDFSRRKTSRVVVVSIDGVAPRFVTPERMPNLAQIVRSGGGCFTARTVAPPLTRPVHASMLRRINPEAHGLTTNDLSPIVERAPTFLSAARESGLVTASFNNWLQIDTLIETKASTYRCFFDAGYDPLEDELMADLFERVDSRQAPDVAFVYLCHPDLVGHDHGWGSDPYLEALTAVDATFGRLVDAAGGADLVVTTDHGGLGTGHYETIDEIMTTFIAVRSSRILPGSIWTEASVLDVAPTVADLAGFAADGNWAGQSLVGREQAMVDHLLSLLAESDNHRYGEDLSMLAHALQSAAVMASSGSDDDLVVAALLHDIGHLLGPAGEHGFPEHGEAAATFLGPWLTAPVTEPIRLHVAAKRHLVASDPDYQARLSPASQVTLAQQGGPFDSAQCETFLAEPHATRAMELRRCDDLGKQPGMIVDNLASYRPRLAAALAAGPIDPSWARDACRCRHCRDTTSDQHLLDVRDLAGWTVLGTRRTAYTLEVDLTNGSTEHRVEIPTAAHPSEPTETLWHDKFDLQSRRRAAADAAIIARDVAASGVAWVEGIPTADGSVLAFAQTLGFVRETNYGRLFDVRTEPSAINLAYTPLALPLHTDNPYRDPVPTVQILHCLQAAVEGGATLLADGFAAAEALRQQDAVSFDILASANVEYRFHDADVDLRAIRRTIDTRPDGTVQAIYLNHRSLDSPTNEQLRRALQSYVDMLEQFTTELTLAAGEAIVFDNRRILHARTGFDASSGRHLQGCYIDVDALRSAAAVQRRRP